MPFKNLENGIMVDVEADGPCPGIHSMICFGAVSIYDKTKTFYGKVAPIQESFQPDILAISKIKREDWLKFPEPKETMEEFRKWLRELVPKGRIVFFSDNPAFDWQFINYYFHRYLGENPFGFSARRIGDIYSGLERDITKTVQWKRFRKTEHDHNPVNDSLGNVEAFLTIMERMKK